MQVSGTNEQQPRMPQRYVLMTAAHNEELLIEKAITSVLGQTIRPVLWAIVSDGSTDRTDEIVEGYARRYTFIQFVKLTRPPGRSFGSKGLALQKCCESIKGITCDFIGNLDADVALEPSYFESLLEHFQRDPQLGIAAGYVYEESAGEYRDRASNRVDSVPHAAQLVRRDCYEAIGGYSVLKYGGEDWYAQQCAKMNGWRAEAIPALKIYHARHTGTASSLLGHQFRLGRLDYSFGSDPFFEFMKCSLRIAEKPWVLGAITRFWGFARSYLDKEQRAVSKEFIDFLRKEQRARVWGMFQGKRGDRTLRAQTP